MQEPEMTAPEKHEMSSEEALEEFGGEMPTAQQVRIDQHHARLGRKLGKAFANLSRTHPEMNNDDRMQLAIQIAFGK